MQKLTTILSWIFGLFCLLVGLGNLVDAHFVSALPFLIAAALLLPPVRTYAGLVSGRTLPWGLRLALVVALVLAAGFLGKR